VYNANNTKFPIGIIIAIHQGIYIFLSKVGEVKRNPNLICIYLKEGDMIMTLQSNIFIHSREKETESGMTDRRTDRRADILVPQL
jgi:hypothetical protein